MELKTFEAVKAEDALIIVAFPTAGAVAPIAAQFLGRHLDLPLVGQLRVPELDHLVAIQDGHATSVVRLYGGEVACGLEKCPRLFVLTTEIAMPPEISAGVTAAVASWAKENKARLVLALEGVTRDEHDDKPDVYTASPDPRVLDQLAVTGAPPAKRAVVAGVAAQVMLACYDVGVPSATLLVEARKDHPDGRAAAALIQVLDRLIPEVRVDPKPLEDEAMELEREIKSSTAVAEGYMQNRPPGMFV